MLKRYSRLASRICLNVYLQFQPDIEQLSQLTVSGDIHVHVYVEMAFINVHFRFLSSQGVVA